MTEHYGQYLDISNDGLSAINTAVANEGIVVYVPANETCIEPIIFHSVSVENEKRAPINIHNLLVMAENAEVKLLEIFAFIPIFIRKL